MAQNCQWMHGQGYKEAILKYFYKEAKTALKKLSPPSNFYILEYISTHSLFIKNSWLEMEGKFLRQCL